MTDTGDRTLDQALASLREAAGQLRAALASRVAQAEDDDEVTARLKRDITKLGQAASDAVTTLGRDLEQQRTTIGETVDRDRAERATTEIKTALGALAGMASHVAAEVTGAAASSVKRADPEISRAIQALDDVLGSAATWIGAVVDPSREQGGARGSKDRPPLDDL